MVCFCNRLGCPECVVEPKMEQLPSFRIPSPKELETASRATFYAEVEILIRRIADALRKDYPKKTLIIIDKATLTSGSGIKFTDEHWNLAIEKSRLAGWHVNHRVYKVEFQGRPKE